jgi:hypothetical protein
MWQSSPWNFWEWPSKPSALWIAVAANLLDTAELLLEKGFSQHPVLPEIGVASYYGHYEMVKLLLDNGANPDARGGTYTNPLQAASYYGHINIVNCLLTLVWRSMHKL